MLLVGAASVFFERSGTWHNPSVPLAVGEGDGFSTFRLGLFGLDKLADVDGTLTRLKTVFDRVF